MFDVHDESVCIVLLKDLNFISEWLAITPLAVHLDSSHGRFLYQLRAAKFRDGLRHHQRVAERRTCVHALLTLTSRFLIVTEVYTRSFCVLMEE